MMTAGNMTLRVGLVQFDVHPGDEAGNLKTAREGIRRLAAAESALAVLPEMWSTGFDMGRLAEHAARTPRTLDILAETAAADKIVIAGSLPEPTDPWLANTLHLHASHRTLALAHPKVHLFRPHREDRFFRAGESCRVCTTSAGRLGLVICYDLRFPEFCRTLTLQGADMLVVCAQWPAVRGHHWDVLLPARALENQLPVVAANRCGSDSSLAYGGHSQIVTAEGAVAAMAGEREPAVLSAPLDKTLPERLRREIPCLDDRRPDIYDKYR